MTTPGVWGEHRAEWERGADARPDRPYVALNMITSVDGRTSLDGRAGPLGSAADQELLERLRVEADAVLVGAGTVRAEGYGDLVSDPALRAARREAGMPEQPLLCVVSRSLSIPTDSPLLTSAGLRLAFLTASDQELDTAGEVHYLRSDDPQAEQLALAPLLRRLRAEENVRVVVCEGGPTLNSSLLAEGLIDELFVTISAKLVGGFAPLPLIAPADTGDPANLELRGVEEREGLVFLRYAVSG